MADIKTVETVIGEIKEKAEKSRKASNGDEVDLMRSMLNDTSFVATTVDNKGEPLQYSPAQTFKKMVTGIIADATGVAKSEAEGLANSYNATTGVATDMIGISKTFVTTMLQTGRKVQLPNGPDSKCTLSAEAKPAGETKVPKTGEVKAVPAYTKIKSSSSCPAWLKK